MIVLKKVEIFKEKIIGYCYANEYNLIKKELKKYSKVKIPTSVCNLPTYIENNKDKIDYSTYEHNNWFVGSGAIESSNKTIVQLRLKQAGMRWSVKVQIIYLFLDVFLRVIIGMI